MPPLLWLALLLGFGTGTAAAVAVMPPGAMAPAILPLGATVLLVAVAIYMTRVVGRPASLESLDDADLEALEAEIGAAGDAEAGPGTEPAPAQAAGPGWRGRLRPPLAAAGVQPIAPEAVARALDEGRVEVLVQPIVSLPQRRVAFFEGCTRLRDERGALILPDAFRPAAERAGLIGRIDALLLARCAQLIDAGSGGDAPRVFVDIARTSLADAAFVDRASALLGARPEIAAGLILELDDIALDRRAADGLARLQRLGVGLSLDRLPSGRIDPKELAARGFSFLKLRADRFREGPDLARLDRDLLALHQALQAAGITTIVDRIESERELAEILDYPVRFGQGQLFGRPTPLAA